MDPAQSTSVPLLPSPTDTTDGTTKVQVNSIEGTKFEALGPLVVNKDGVRTRPTLLVYARFSLTCFVEDSFPHSELGQND